MLQGAPPELAPDSVRETLAAVFQQGVYHRPLRRSLWQYIVGWWHDMMRALFGAMREIPWAQWAVIGAAVLVILLVIARVLFLRRARDPGTAGRLSQQSSQAADPWTVARKHAAAGRYLDAAHALYLAMLESVASRDRLSLDPAKTVGDYARELRAASSARLPGFREFARAYEPVVWGSRDCSKERYEALEAIAGRAMR